MKFFDRCLISLFSIMLFTGTGGAALAYGNGPDNAGLSVSNAELQKHVFDRSVILTFKKRNSTLTEKDQTKLRNLVTTIGLDHIDRIEVAAWSDKSFPKTGKNLPQFDRDLADNRIGKISDFLKQNFNISSTKTFNMAETSNWLARTFKTDNAELKSIFSKEGSAPMEREDFTFIKTQGSAFESHSHCR